MKSKNSRQRSFYLPGVMALALSSGIVNAGPPEFAPGAAKASPRAFPDIKLPGRANGENAVSALGKKLPDVAAYYGRTPAEFAHLLRKDDTAWIDVKGRLLFIDHFPGQAGESTASDPLQEASFPLSETFTLNSRPGSKRVIYLDFDGHETSGTAWNSSSGVNTIISPAYTRDSDPTFSTLELQYIQGMWRQVAEDFAPFDVNITTQDPGQAAITRSSSGDEYYGTRVVITKDNFDSCGCGGFAYLTAFNDVGDYYKPAFVFNTSLVGAGEAITHEVGHNLSLSHDGTSSVGYYQGHGSGATGWAPIMGVGYYQDLVQWSKGEYGDANESEDDLARIPVYGAPLMADDHGDSDGQATALDTSSDGSTVSLSGTGLIQIRDDVDVFSFISGGGNFSINVDPAPVSPNLDILAELRDSGGVLVSSSNPESSLPAVLGGNLPAGEYFLAVEGVGEGDPAATGYSDYGSLGRYSVSGSVPDPGGLSAPLAVASATPDTTPGYPLDVAFDGNGSSSTNEDGNIDQWDWDFDDGNSGTGSTVNHTYMAPGTYHVTLTVTDDHGLTGNDSVSVVVPNRAPQAVAGTDTITGQAPLEVGFNSNGSNDPDEPANPNAIASYAWDFGDGNNSAEADPIHEFTAGGLFNVTLTVTDAHGASDVDSSLLLDIAPPAFVDQYATGQVSGAGTVSGGLANIKTAGDSLEQSVGEIESGGRKRNRHSYLEHSWIFNVQSGDAVTLFLKARHVDTSDNDLMEFSYTAGGSSYALDVNLLQQQEYEIGLPAATSGEVRVHVKDSDQTGGNRSLDTVYVDQLYIRSENGSGVEPPPPPESNAPNPASWGSVAAVSFGQIDLNWNDNSSDEDGFRIDISSNQINWSTEDVLAAGQTFYSDTGLPPATTFYYRVVAYKGANNADPTEVRSATTDPENVGAITLSASGYKSKGVKHVILTWSGIGNADIHREDKLEIMSDKASGYDDDIGTKGGGSYLYKVCPVGSSNNCSNEATVVF